MITYKPGDTFGRLAVIGPAASEPRFFGCRGWLCRCSCGKEIAVSGTLLRRGCTRSCGCLRTEMIVARTLTHGRTGTREYKAWQDAKRRCANPRRQSYPRYGGRGLTMSREWRDSFEAFLSHMGPCPSGLSLDRIDNARGYEAGNCRWTDAFTQSNNRPSYNRSLTFDGLTMNVEQWNRHLGFPRALVRKRLFRGWPVERALSTPPR